MGEKLDQEVAQKSQKKRVFKTLLFVKKIKAGYMATKVACGWAGAIFEVIRSFGQEQCGQRNQIMK